MSAGATNRRGDRNQVIGFGLRPLRFVRKSQTLPSSRKPAGLSPKTAEYEKIGLAMLRPATALL